MHETMVAEGLLVSILAEAKKQNARPRTVKISCGMFNALNDEIINFAFEAIAKDTICQGLQLEILHKPIRGKCEDCKESFDFEISAPNCPACGSDAFELSPDAPLMLEEIEFETE